MGARLIRVGMHTLIRGASGPTELLGDTANTPDNTLEPRKGVTDAPELFGIVHGGQTACSGRL